MAEMREIAVEVDGITYRGHYVVEGKRKLRLKVIYNGNEKTDAFTYRLGQTGYIEIMAKQILREIVTGRSL